MLHLAIFIHVKDNEMYTCKQICLFDNFSHSTNQFDRYTGV